ncbi:TonB family protein [Aestuariibius insulae]|uniref:energy transducer TonB family protein n=1 Tax=Aestuariibius insulae TaxID=2058287 RepID=UPI00345ECD55
MIRSSLWAISVFAVIAVTFHLVPALAFVSEEEALIESRTGSFEARIGSSFADFSQGILEAEAVTASETLTPQTPEQAEPKTSAEPISPSDTVSAETAIPRPTSDALAGPEAPVLAPSQPSTPQSAERVSPRSAEQTPPAETLRAIESTTAVSRSLRPSPRPDRPRQAERPRRSEPPQTEQAPSRGNRAQQNQTAGSAQGTQRATSAQAGVSSGQAVEAGTTAAATNYPGEVMRRISRVPKPRVGSRGLAVVSFSIAASGGLQSASIAQSSGSARLDQAALQVIQRAAPFPPPPAGARRSFSIRIEGAG